MDSTTTITMLSQIGNILPVLGLIISIGSFIWALGKGWEALQNRNRVQEENHEELKAAFEEFMESTVKNAEDSVEAKEHMLESLYQLTTAVRGLDGHNGLTGRTLLLEERINDLAERVAKNEGKISIWQDFRKFAQNGDT